MEAPSTSRTIAFSVAAMAGAAELVEDVIAARAADPSVRTVRQVLHALHRDGEWQGLTLPMVRRAVTAANAQQPKLAKEEKAHRRKELERQRDGRCRTRAPISRSAVYWPSIRAQGTSAPRAWSIPAGAAFASRPACALPALLPPQPPQVIGDRVTRAEIGAPNWKLGLPMLPTVELSVYEHVIENMIDEARSQVIALPPTEIADRNGMKGELV